MGNKTTDKLQILYWSFLEVMSNYGAANTYALGVMIIPFGP